VSSSSSTWSGLTQPLRSSVPSGSESGSHSIPEVVCSQNVKFQRASPSLDARVAVSETRASVL
jgi:hypothetical protein